MRMTDRGFLALVRHEGIVPGPYLDVKQVWTFGIGHTAAAGPPDPATMPRGMPADLDAGIREAFRVFRADLAAYEADVRPRSFPAGRPSETCSAMAAIPAARSRSGLWTARAASTSLGRSVA